MQRAAHGGPLLRTVEGEQPESYLVLASAFILSSVLPLASALPLGASLPSMVVAIILYLIMTLSPFLISPVVLVSLSRAISQLSLPFLTMMTSSLTSTTGPVT